ncbi:bifunctional TH2 protein, mitochondrial-like isoform X2 [Diospyros lotus]|uniref:bifunctional TH2 protein, mitochondrial-like isoform X2 n=1 Tax=Diospyros lotus TaxID=55363 RepID=UPI00225A1391|nr:bifunctional TH2 protein, mitochondrial-like isoform X2 [Diospyros lotus]
MRMVAAGEEGGGGEGEGIARRLWIKFNSESVFALYTPFVVCLASGVLDPQSFVRCISQDAFFLQAFARAYELAEEYADDEEDKDAIGKLRKRVLKRLDNRDDLVRWKKLECEWSNHTLDFRALILLDLRNLSSCVVALVLPLIRKRFLFIHQIDCDLVHKIKEWGFDLPSERISVSATVKYTDFLLATASGKVEGEKSPGNIATPFEKTKLAAYTFAAVGPCMRLYAFISKEILTLQELDQSNHIYKKWIDNLASQNYEETAFQIENLLDKLSISLTGEELKIIEKLYEQAVKLEVKFFSAQQILQQTVVPFYQPDVPVERTLRIFCDFDMTCTAIDSTALLAEIAIRTASKADLNGYETQLTTCMSSADLRTTWAALSSQYSEEYEQCMGSIMAGEKVEEFNYEDLCRALELLSDFEKKSNSRVIESGVLKGLNLEDINWAGEHLVLQDGCKGFFQEMVKCENLKTDVHVLSYCWCGDLIRAAFSSGELNVKNVHSNELEYEELVTTGDIIKKVESPMEKLRVFNDITEGSSKLGEHFTVYVGGSVGDLLCLLKADIGIVIGWDSSLRRVGDHFGISFVPLFSGLVTKQKELTKGCTSNWKGGPSSTLYTVSSWAEIHAFLLGL